MADLLDLAAAINTLYIYIYWYIEDKDFVDLTEGHYAKLPISEKNKKWFVINPIKLRPYTKTTLIVDEADKKHLVAAVRLICAISQNLPETSSFRERLLYCKGFLPACMFDTQKQVK